MSTCMPNNSHLCQSNSITQETELELQQRASLGQDDWASVLFTVESGFSLQTHSHHSSIWREHGIHNNPSNICKHDTFRGSGLLVWVGTMFNGCISFHVLDRGNWNALCYRDEILENYGWLFKEAVGPQFLLMDDNVTPHRTPLDDKFL